MKFDSSGVHCVTSSELFDLLYQQPTLSIEKFNVVDPEIFNYAVGLLYADIPKLRQYVQAFDIEAFDAKNQMHWLMPADYYELDIAEWVLNQCSNDAELQRCGEELLLYQERDAFNLLRYLKYLVDVMRTHNIIWGVGRGSSVASFVLYKIGVHRINSLYYDLDPQEFLK